MYQKLFLASLALSVPLASAAEYDDFGPAAFMWPDDRVWSAAVDNTAPCGSVASPSNRTNFPMENGQIALVAQDDSWEIELSISYEDDPKSNDDFITLIDAENFREMDPGHTCIPVSDSPDSVTPGDKATLQIRYIADFDTPDNQTFYACADIVFVELAEFDIKVPCFNATGPEDEDESGPGWDYHDDVEEDENEDNASETASPSASSSADSSEDGEDDQSNEGGEGGSSGISGGAIAGIVVGAVAGIALIAGALLFLYRRKQQRQRVARQQNTSRGVKWEDNDAAAKGSVSSSSVKMQNLPA